MTAPEATSTLASIDDAFAQFAADERGWMLRTAWLLTGQRASAEDLVQNSLESVWRHWGRVSSAGSPRAYVRKAMVNTYISSQRRAWNRETPSEAVPDSAAAGDAHRTVEQRLLLTTALGRLPARQRAAVVLRYFHDLSEAQTAEAMSCSTGTVKSQVHKALRTLRDDEGLSALLGEF